MNTKLNLAALSLLAALLAGCGGGGDGTDTAGIDGGGGTNTAGAAEGLWTGLLNGIFPSQLAVMENGATYGLTYTGSGSSALVYYRLYGNTTVNGSQLSGSGIEQDDAQGTRFNSVTYTGTVSPKGSITLAFPDESRITNTSTIVANYSSSYDSSPTDLSSMAGTYNRHMGYGSQALGNQEFSATLTLTAAGAFTIAPTTTAVGACHASGTITPRASGKNVFNVTVTLGTDCLGGSSVLQGITFGPGTTMLALNGAKTTYFSFH